MREDGEDGGIPDPVAGSAKAWIKRTKPRSAVSSAAPDAAETILILPSAQVTEA